MSEQIKMSFIEAAAMGPAVERFNAAKAILENLGEQLRRGGGEFGDVLARLRAEQADAGADAAGDAGAVLFDAGPRAGGGAAGAGGRVEGGWRPSMPGPSSPACSSAPRSKARPGACPDRTGRG